MLQASTETATIVMREKGPRQNPHLSSVSTPAIKKRTERTRSCDVCHVDKENFLTKEKLIKGGSRANEELIYVPKPIKK
jgi:hypothetical protein